MRYVLDTNIIVIYLKHSKLRTQIDKTYNPFSTQNIPILSAVTLGELESLALRNNWGLKRIESTESLIGKCVVTEINYADLHKRYGEIDAFSQGKLTNKKLKMSSRNMGKNDLWIAATASILNAILITTDKDFDHLDKEYFDLIRVEV